MKQGTDGCLVDKDKLLVTSTKSSILLYVVASYSLPAQDKSAELLKSCHLPSCIGRVAQTDRGPIKTEKFAAYKLESPMQTNI